MSTISSSRAFGRGALIGAVLLFALLGMRLLLNALASPAPTVSDVPRCQTIFSDFGARSTDLQKLQYIEALRGQVFTCDATVTNVTTDGTVYATPGNPALRFVDWNLIILYGVPASDARLIRSGDSIHFSAKVKDRAGNLGLQLESEFIEWNNPAAALKQQ